MKKEKRKTYRERYFEDYQAVKVPCGNKKGYRIEYRYIGLFSRYDADGKFMGSAKGLIACAELLGLVLYVPAMLSGSAFTLSRLANGFGTLSLIPWLLSCSGVARFLVGGTYIKEASCREIGSAIDMGCLLHALLLGLSAVTGTADILLSGTAARTDLPVLAAVLFFAGVSLLIRWRYNRLLVLTYRNENGHPGTRM